MQALKARGIDSRPVFQPMHTQPIYNTGQCLPVAEDLAAHGLSLPSSTNLQSEDVQRVGRAIAACSHRV